LIGLFKADLDCSQQAYNSGDKVECNTSLEKEIQAKSTSRENIVSPAQFWHVCLEHPTKSA